MISCYLSGGLGNQLFQICTTISYCIQHNKSFIFPHEKSHLKEKNRPVYWEHFLKALKPYTTKHSSQTIENILQYKIFPEPEHTYVPIPPQIEDNNGNAILKGFFQSYKYFDGHFPAIRSILQLDDLLKNTLATYKPFSSENEHKISAHFRMGDYKQIRCYHPVMPWEYYMYSIQHILEKRHLETSSQPTTKKIVVYCFFENEDTPFVLDYIKHIKQHLEMPSADYTIEFKMMSYIHYDWEQLLIMSGCDDHIIANSSFSWWGAYLNVSNTKIVCYPSVWYGHQLYYIDNRDMFPENWKCIHLDKNTIHIPCNCNL